MGNTLMILEVSRKQDYIFARKELRENALRSRQINYVTSSSFFQDVAKKAAERETEPLYCEEENLVYAGGGHTILQFSSQEKAVAFARCVTEETMRRYQSMEIFVKTMPYDQNKTPGENLQALSEALERKKALRQASFRQGSFGVEALDKESLLPKLDKDGEDDEVKDFTPLNGWKRDGWEYPVLMDKLAGEDNFVAVVHIDGNAMGKRVSALYDQREAADWEQCCEKLRRFSTGIQEDFEAAFNDMVQTVIDSDLKPEKPNLPVRPVILAGDDVCFVTAGNIGLECARVFLEKLAEKKNTVDKKAYSACAGVAIVHEKYPFHQAYDLAEELCSNAKRFGAELDKNGAVSAMDWHIEFGQLKDSLAELRKDYETEDGNRLELRPVVVCAPDGVDLTPANVRNYTSFRIMCEAMQREYGKIARGKLKDLRTALQQGKVESEFFLHDKQIRDLLYHGFEAEFNTPEARNAKYQEMLKDGGKLEKNAFVQIGDTERCLFFDAIELIDHCRFLNEKAKEKEGENA
ncbi:MAG: hypothetical protein LIO78_02845 [Clostridiales bacterium]|nr:hypothetical protein [Clostridiales bacterium]